MTIRTPHKQAERLRDTLRSVNGKVRQLAQALEATHDDAERWRSYIRGLADEASDSATRLDVQLADLRRAAEDDDGGR